MLGGAVVEVGAPVSPHQVLITAPDNTNNQGPFWSDRLDLCIFYCSFFFYCSWILSVGLTAELTRVNLVDKSPFTPTHSPNWRIQLIITERVQLHQPHQTRRSPITQSEQSCAQQVEHHTQRFITTSCSTMCNTPMSQTVKIKPPNSCRGTDFTSLQLS